MNYSVKENLSLILKSKPQVDLDPELVRRTAEAALLYIETLEHIISGRKK